MATSRNVQVILTNYFMCINRGHYVIYLQNMKFERLILWPGGAYTDTMHILIHESWLHRLIGKYPKWAQNPKIHIKSTRKSALKSTSKSYENLHQNLHQIRRRTSIRKERPLAGNANLSSYPESKVKLAEYAINSDSFEIRITFLKYTGAHMC